MQQLAELQPSRDRMAAAPPRCRTAAAGLGDFAQNDEECADPFDGCSMLGVRSCSQPASLASVPSSATTLALGTVDAFEPKKPATSTPPAWDVLVTATTPSSAYPPLNLQGGARAGGIYSAAASGSGPCASLTLHRADGISG